MKVVTSKSGTYMSTRSIMSRAQTISKDREKKIEMDRNGRPSKKRNNLLHVTL